MKYLMIAIMLLVSVLGCGGEPTVEEREAALLMEMNDTDAYGAYSAFVDSLETYGYTYFVSYEISASNTEVAVQGLYIAIGATGRVARELDDKGVLVVEFSNAFMSLDVTDCITAVDMLDADAESSEIGEFLADKVTITDR